MKHVGALSLAVSAFARSKQDRGGEDLSQEHRDVLYGGMCDDGFASPWRKSSRGLRRTSGRIYPASRATPRAMLRVRRFVERPETS